MIGFALFRGLRIGEIRAINIKDFKNPEFNKIDVIIQKSNIKDEFPILEEFAAHLKTYIVENLHTFKGGYLFPTYTKTDKPYICRGVSNDMFWKYRKKLMAKYPEFADKVIYHGYNFKTGKKYEKHRVGWHSMRRWFETQLWEKGYKIAEISHIMRYKSPKTVYTYLDCYNTWKKEREILKDTFGLTFKDMIGFVEGQRTLVEFTA